jgi:hypothetical protein
VNGGSERVTRELAILGRSDGGAVDGIRDHGIALAAAVSRQRRWTARTVDLGAAKPRDLASVLSLEPGGRVDVVLLQYNPFSYGRRGIAPWLAPALAKLHRGQPSVLVAVLVHETFVPASSPSWAVLNVLQRLQLRAVIAQTAVRLETTSQWASSLPPGTATLPVGSNLPDRSGARTAVRARLGASESTVILAAFGTGHPSRPTSWLEEGVRAARATGGDLLVLNLGHGAVAIPDGGSVFSPGLLPATDVAEYLAASDLFLSPLTDGVSARRTTIVAALQHALPVVGTRTGNSDPELVDSEALVLVDTDDRVGFADAVQRLTSDASERNRRSAAARLLYQTTFDWDVIAARLIGVLESQLAKGA